MSHVKRWLWEAYLVIAVFFAVQQFLLPFNPEEPHRLYYAIARTFHPVFYLHYAAFLGNAVLGLVHCVPLFLYIHKKRFLHPNVWKVLFVLRCLFELTGHSYEMNTLTAFFRINPQLVALTLFVTILPHVPWYIVCFDYAFRREKVLGGSRQVMENLVVNGKKNKNPVVKEN